MICIRHTARQIILKNPKIGNFKRIKNTRLLLNERSFFKRYKSKSKYVTNLIIFFLIDFVVVVLRETNVIKDRLICSFSKHQ